MTPLTKPCTSSCSTRPLGPLPPTFARSTPSSRANLRTDGLACGREVVASFGSAGTGLVRGIGAAAAGADSGLGAAGAGLASFLC